MTVGDKILNQKYLETFNLISNIFKLNIIKM